MFIVVTGASRGIGLEIVKQFLADEENTVLAVSRNARELDKLKKSNANLITVYGDLTKTSVLNSIASLIDKNGKRVDILINNAGAIVNKPFEKIKSEEIQQVYSVNVFAPFLLIQKLLPRMGKKSKSHIVNIGSMGGFQGSSKFAGLSAYSSSKSAIAGLTECLAEELKPKNITVNCLAIGAVQTEMLSKAFPGFKAPLQPQQMANYIVEFALTGHQYYNGKILPVSSTTP
ncbi:MAG: SDR family oxidoreductase [Bacteroidetes bacterium]|nr:SDR family oxidoreductase [Bacteroidota bacterium]